MIGGWVGISRSDGGVGVGVGVAPIATKKVVKMPVPRLCCVVYGCVRGTSSFLISDFPQTHPSPPAPTFRLKL